MEGWRGRGVPGINLTRGPLSKNYSSCEKIFSFPLDTLNLGSEVINLTSYLLSPTLKSNQLYG